MSAEERAKAKREAVLSLIPPAWKLPTPVESAEQQRDVTGPYVRRFLSDREVEITETDAPGILSHTMTGRWSARNVTAAFCHRAALAHQLTPCLHEIFFDQALAAAATLDTYFERHGAPCGPLHGLPVSLKDQFHVRGVNTHMGYVGWIGTFEGQAAPQPAESEMVRALRRLGAVLFCKTSVPHTLMSGETFNKVVGYTWNPRNRLLSCGGSSGGEGALIALRGSPLGFGTDIGGSIRIPAAFNGQFGLKPSSGRLPYEGMANSMDGQSTVLSVVGPLASCVRGLRLAVTALLAQEPWLTDPMVHELPWRDAKEAQTRAQLAAGRSCFGMVWEQAGVAPHPPITRALRIVSRTLERLGHKVLDWDTSSHPEASAIVDRAFAYDRGADFRRQFVLGGERPHPFLDVAKGGPPAGATDIAANNVAKRRFQKAYLDRWMATRAVSGTGRPVDAVIAPVAPFAAARPGKYRYYGYTAWVNCLDYSACVIPVTTADKSVDRVDGHFEPKSSLGREIMDLYDPELYDGTPVGLQIVCRRLEEEKVYAVAEYLSDALSDEKPESARL